MKLSSWLGGYSLKLVSLPVVTVGVCYAAEQEVKIKKELCTLRSQLVLEPY